MDLTVAVIAKACVPGRVKTRLSPPLAPHTAAALAQLSLSRTLDSVRILPARRRLLIMDGTPIARDAAGFTVLPQASGALDERLAAICDAVSSPLLIIGMDTPQVSRYDVAPLLHDWSTAGARTRHGWARQPTADSGRWRCPAGRRPNPGRADVHDDNRGPASSPGSPLPGSASECSRSCGTWTTSVTPCRSRRRFRAGRSLRR